MSESLRIRPTIAGNPTASIQPVDNVGVSNVQPPVQQQPPQEPPVMEAASARSMAQRLDSMLFKVAQAATRSVNSTRMHRALSETGVSPAMRSKLADAADQAAGTFASLAKLSGRQIANALVIDENGKFDWSDSAAAEMLKEALDAQADLSALLHEVVSDPKVTGEGRKKATTPRLSKSSKPR